MDDSISRQAAIDDIKSRDPSKIWDIVDIEEWVNTLPSAQPDVTAINKFIDGLEEIFADIRESHVDDSVCGLCEFDGAYIGESGDWCNECPGFNRDDCFKLRDGIREKWITEITNAVPSVQSEHEYTMEEFMFGQDMGNPEDGSL